MRWKITDEGIELAVSRTEMALLNNGLNESLAFLDERTFPTRMGASSRDARALLLDLRSLRAALDPEFADLLRVLDTGGSET